MSCKSCEKYIEKMDTAAYYRWETTNIELVGCPTHLSEIIIALNKIQRGKEK